MYVKNEIMKDYGDIIKETLILRLEKANLFEFEKINTCFSNI